ncbi:MAG: hypothetical protein ABL931_17360 [Usitatibacteraceae bacterium]
MAFIFCSAIASAGTQLPIARDMMSEAKQAERFGLPLIVLVSLKGCVHCEVVRRSHLMPLLGDSARSPAAVVRQVEIDGRELLRDFGGKQITHAEFAKRNHADIAPVVFFFDAKGRSLSAPLVGSMIPDFYGAYLDAALVEALRLWRSGLTPPRSRAKNQEPGLRPGLFGGT